MSEKDNKKTEQKSLDTFSEKDAGTKNLTLSDMMQMRGQPLAQRVSTFSEFEHNQYSNQELLYMREICSSADRVVKIKDPYTNEIKDMLMFGSNNYLGFANHPYIKKRVNEAVEKYGTGIGGPPLLNGTTSLHTELQEKLARLKRKEECLIYSSGYSTNIGWVSVLMERKDLIFFDQYSHASFIDGLRMNKIRAKSFKHNDIQNLREKLEKSVKNKDPKADIYVITEGVFSMDGDVAKLNEILKLKEEFGFYLIVDDAHGLGVVGENGHGIHEYFNLGKDDIDIIMGTFSKALAVTGGFVAGNRDIIHYLRWLSRPYMFSASLPPTVIMSVLAGLELLEKEKWRNKRLKENTQYLVDKLHQNGIDVNTDSAMVCVIVPEDVNIRKAGKKLHDLGIFVNSIEFPAVPRELQRFRINMMTNHTKEDIKYLVECLVKVLGY